MRLLHLFKSDFAAESREWVENGLIEENQARNICARYGADYDLKNQKSFGYLFLLVLGYLFAGIALVILIGENWEGIPRSLRAGGLIVLTILTNYFGYRCYPSSSKRGVALFALGGLLYGASIILIAQIYHLGEHMPDGVFWWAIGLLPFVWFTRSNWFLLFPLTLATIWFFMEFYMEFYRVGFVVFPLLGLYGAFRWEKNFLSFFYSLVLFIFWMNLTFNHYFDFNEAQLWMILTAMVFASYGGALWLEKQTEDPHSMTYGVLGKIWALRFGVFFLFLATFETVWRLLLGGDALWHSSNKFVTFQFENSAFIWSVVLVSVGLCAVIVALTYKRLTKSYLVCGAFFTLFLVFMAVFGAKIDWNIHLPVVQIISNLVFFAFAILLIFLGIERNVSHFFFLGVFSILLLAFVRYVNLVGGYIGGALLFFILAGVLLYAAKFWRKRTTELEGVLHE